MWGRNKNKFDVNEQVALEKATLEQQLAEAQEKAIIYAEILRDIGLNPDGRYSVGDLLDIKQVLRNAGVI